MNKIKLPVNAVTSVDFSSDNLNRLLFTSYGSRYSVGPILPNKKKKRSSEMSRLSADHEDMNNRYRDNNNSQLGTQITTLLEKGPKMVESFEIKGSSALAQVPGFADPDIIFDKKKASIRSPSYLRRSCDLDISTVVKSKNEILTSHKNEAKTFSLDRMMAN